MKAYEGLESATRVVFSLGHTYTASEIRAADTLRAWFSTYITELFKEHSLSAIVTPTSPIDPPILTEEVKKSGVSDTALVYQVMKYMSMVNFLGLPAHTVPVGYSKSGLPIGLQFIGKHWDEAVLLRLANTVDDFMQNSADFLKNDKDGADISRRPPLYFDALV